MNTLWNNYVLYMGTILYVSSVLCKALFKL